MPEITSGLASRPTMPSRSWWLNRSVPRSPTVIGTPPRLATTMLPRSSRVRTSPTPRTTKLCSPRDRREPPAFALLLVMAVVTSFSPMPKRCNSTGSKSRRNSLVKPPKLVTSAMPGTCFSAGMTTQRWISDSSIKFLLSDSSV